MLFFHRTGNCEYIDCSKSVVAAVFSIGEKIFQICVIKEAPRSTSSDSPENYLSACYIAFSSWLYYLCDCKHQPNKTSIALATLRGYFDISATVEKGFESMNNLTWMGCIPFRKGKDTFQIKTLKLLLKNLVMQCNSGTEEIRGNQKLIIVESSLLPNSLNNTNHVTHQLPQITLLKLMA